MSILPGLLALIFDPKAVRLQEHDRAFNPLRILGVERYEIRHVNTLAWLLDPSESHGLGDSFFKLFMRAICEEQDALPVLAKAAESGDSALHVRREVTTRQLQTLARSEADAALRGALQTGQEKTSDKPREGFLDLLVQGEGWLVGLEAKIASKLHSQQLERYRTAIAQGAPNTLKLLVYLNCNEKDKPDDVGWVHVTWQKAVVEPLRRLLSSPARLASDAPQIVFLRGYLEVLEEQCGMQDNDRETLLSELVEAHSELLSKISGRGTVKKLSEQDRELVRLNSRLIDELARRYQSPARKRYPDLMKMLGRVHDPKLVLAKSTSSTIRFLPTSWLEDFAWIQEPQRPYPRVICEMFNRPDFGVQFKLMVCDLGGDFARDLNYDKRRALLAAIQANTANSELFPRAFLSNLAPREPDDRYFGVLLTDWYGADDLAALQAAMERDFMPAVRALTALMAQV